MNPDDPPREWLPGKHTLWIGHPLALYWTELYGRDVHAGGLSFEGHPVKCATCYELEREKTEEEKRQ